MDHYNIAFIGCGVSTVFALQRLNELGFKQSAIIFDIGRPPLKRRSQINGWLGSMPMGDGKLFHEPDPKLSSLLSADSSKYLEQAFAVLKRHIQPVEVENKLPTKKQIKEVETGGFSFVKHDFSQIFPKDIHFLSKKVSSEIYDLRNFNFKFDEEVISVKEENGKYIITTSTKEYSSDKLVISVGRAGWRWGFSLLKSFGVVKENKLAKLGIRIEVPDDVLKKFNKCCCSLLSDDLTVGPILWNGTVIPEDHCDLIITSFRSNEGRWLNDKASFSLLAHIEKENAQEYLANISCLTHIAVTNERVLKEPLEKVYLGKSDLAKLVDYGFTKNGNNWLVKSLDRMESILPGMIKKGISYSPTISTADFELNIDSGMKTSKNTLYALGESAGFKGIITAIMSGLSFADNLK